MCARLYGHPVCLETFCSLQWNLIKITTLWASFNFSQLVTLYIKCGLEEVEILMLCSVTVTSDSQRTFENFYVLLTQHITSGGSSPAFGGQSNREEPNKVFTCLNIKGCLRRSLGITQKWLHFVGHESGYFCWSYYAIFQGTTTVWKRFKSNVWSGSQSKRSASFFMSYT